MVEKTLDLKILSQSLLRLITEQIDVPPKVMSVGIVIPRDEFNRLAVDHPNLVSPNLLQASKTTDDRSFQWSIQIRPETTIEDFPPDIQERLKPPE